ncbi:unnamed protein product [Arctia plantaginis]|uniref:Uncharacterized protein n=1 Tax=Arctia plantaginis TaxID=874455 RepID=A0A8S1A4C7_ARCPL|nr:unnamed protein product [Arctia plantaginis]
MDSMSENVMQKEKLAENDVNDIHEKDNLTLTTTESPIKQDVNVTFVEENKTEEPEPAITVANQQDNNDEDVLHDSVSESEDNTKDRTLSKREFTRKRYSVDYKRTHLNFKRFSVDFRRDSATLEELERLEQELARTNVDARIGGRRKSSGILKSSSNSTNGVSEHRSNIKPESDTEDDEVVEQNATKTAESEGPREPPATPVGRDELALRRHRFFSDLVCAARAAVEHRVRFDPLGPVVADTGEDGKNCILFSYSSGVKCCKL